MKLENCDVIVNRYTIESEEIESLTVTDLSTFGPMSITDVVMRLKNSCGANWYLKQVINTHPVPMIPFLIKNKEGRTLLAAEMIFLEKCFVYEEFTDWMMNASTMHNFMRRE